MDAPHPYGVRPGGALWIAVSDVQRARKRPREDHEVDAENTSTEVSTRARGLGRLAFLSDQLLLDVLGCFNAVDLARVVQVSRALYVFGHHSDLWRALTLEQFGAAMRFDHVGGSWKQTWVQSAHPSIQSSASSSDVRTMPRHRPFPVRTIFSDLLFKVRVCVVVQAVICPPHRICLRQSWACARLVPSFPTHVTSRFSIPRVDASRMTVAEFEARFERTNRPVLLQGVASQWHAVREQTATLDRLAERFGDRLFTAGGFRMPMREYAAYARSVTDDQPLYLFDPRFDSTAPELLTEYVVPPWFADDRDAFASLPPRWRPDRRWLIVGPARSGSTFHKDPNATSAWNAILSGSKYWILTPPGRPPPGVHATQGGAMVAAPMSLMEWVLDFYRPPPSTTPDGSEDQRELAADHSHEDADDHDDAADAGRLEGVARAGDIMFVPRGWWHAAINLEPTVAITQNYMPLCALEHGLRFLRDKPDQVSGVSPADAPLMYDRLVQALRASKPDILEPALEALRKPLSIGRTAITRAWSSVLGSGTEPPDVCDADARSSQATAALADTDLPPQHDDDACDLPLTVSAAPVVPPPSRFSFSFGASTPSLGPSPFARLA